MSSTSLPIPKKNGKHSKRPNPFHIRNGNIVAIRQQKHFQYLPNHHSSTATTTSNDPNIQDFHSIWVDRIPNRLDGLALIGKHVRFDSRLLELSLSSFKSSYSSSKKDKSIESLLNLSPNKIKKKRQWSCGEVISILDPNAHIPIDCHKTKQTNIIQGIQVEILIDISPSTSTKHNHQNKMNFDQMSTAQKRKHYGEIIRGPNKIILSIILPTNHNDDHDNTKFKWEILSFWTPMTTLPTKNIASSTSKSFILEPSLPSSSSQNSVNTNDSQINKNANNNNNIPLPQYPDHHRRPSNIIIDPNQIGIPYRDSHYLQQHSMIPYPQFPLGKVIDIQIPTTLSESKETQTNHPPSHPNPLENDSTLAIVKIQLFLLPEYTIQGRTNSEDDMVLYPYLNHNGDYPHEKCQYYNVPIENLIVIGKSLSVPSKLSFSTYSDRNSFDFYAGRSYDYSKKIYKCESKSKPKLKPNQNSHPSKNIENGHSGQEKDATSNEYSPNKYILHSIYSTVSKISSITKNKLLPSQTQTDTNSFTENRIRTIGEKDLIWDLDMKGITKVLRSSRRHLSKRSHPMDYFRLPHDFWISIQCHDQETRKNDKNNNKRPMKRKKVETSNNPKAKGRNGKSINQTKKDTSASKRKKSTVVKLDSTVESKNQTPISSPIQDDTTKISLYCSRMEYYNRNHKKNQNPKSSKLYDPSNVIRGYKCERNQLRYQVNLPKTGTTAISSSSRASQPMRNLGRAARANQRRMLRQAHSQSFNPYEVNMLTLSRREPKLRFARSSIHAWGVFAEEAISKNALILEYRGELIGNALADRREQIYEDAMIGSDYMFRIDKFLVCDATKEGSLARYLNASCCPNCKTQIFSVNGVKKIGIYAKRNIQCGEELCYDYKFPLECDETKRIQCQCGAKSCRGYMNWDKRYDSLQLKKTNLESKSSQCKHKS